MKAREEGEGSGPRRRKTRRVRRGEEGMLVSAAALDLQALRRQSRRIRIRGKLREKCNRNPDEAKKDRKATPNQKRNARPVAKIKESNAGRDSEEGHTDHKARSAERECSRKRRKFGGSAGQLDHQHY